MTQFVCPMCERTTLVVTQRLVLPSDCQADEITLQGVVCDYCGFETLAVYQARRGGSGDSVSHRGYYISPNDYRNTRDMMRYCPKPTSPDCRCSAHRTLSRQDEQGCWLELAGITHEGTFDLLPYPEAGPMS